MKVLSADSINQILSEAKKTEYFALFFTYHFTGARRGEVIGLRW
jgi:integrase